MTREEAIVMLKEIRHYLTAGNPVWDVDEIAEACDMAIEALEGKDTNVPTKDLISRQDAIEAVATVTMSIHLSNVLCDKLLALPSAEPKTGKWLSGDCMGAHCSECDEYTPFTPTGKAYNYCPNCGAKMKGGDDE